MSANSYIQLWRGMLNNIEYEGLSLEAVVCYCVLADRHRLSEITEYRDSQGRLCVVYPQESLGRILRCKRKKVAKVLRELEDCGLIVRRHQGMNRADAIYVRMLTMSLSGTSECTDEGHTDSPYTYTNNNYNNTNVNNDIDRDCVCAELIDLWDYRSLSNQGEAIADMAGKLIDVATSIMCTTNTTIYIAGEIRVQATIMKLTSVHIEFIARRIVENQDTIDDMYGYMMASLYNSGTQIPG